MIERALEEIDATEDTQRLRAEKLAALLGWTIVKVGEQHYEVHGDGANNGYPFSGLDEVICALEGSTKARGGASRRRAQELAER